MIRSELALIALLLLTLCACGDDEDSAADGGKAGASGRGGSGAAAMGGSGKPADAGSGGNASAGRSGGGGMRAGAGGNAGRGPVAGSSGAGGAGKGGNSGSSSCWVKPLMNDTLPWNQSVEKAGKDAQSDTIIAALQTAGWGAGRLQIDYSIDVLCASASAPLRSFEKTDDFFDGECNDEQVPVPQGGHLEGEDDYQCIGDGDCHLIVIKEDTHTLYEQWVIVIKEDTHTLYEQWRANIVGSTYSGGCLAVWDLTRDYPATLRGDQCSSADAAGLPIAPLLFDADEVAAGEIKHAVRFALPNTHLRKGTYVRPATHATNAASAGASGVPYGARLRLRADYDIDSLPSEGAKVLARALQRYGMIMADGGNIALMGQDDRSTAHKWADVLEPRALQAIQPKDFEMVDGGERYTWKGDCTLAN